MCVYLNHVLVHLLGHCIWQPGCSSEPQCTDNSQFGDIEWLPACEDPFQRWYWHHRGQGGTHRGV